MGVGAFTDKTDQPGLDRMEAALGARSEAWVDVTRFLRENYRVKEECKFYGKSYGWALRFRKSGKALVSLYPCEGRFMAQVVLDPEQAAAALESSIGKKVKTLIEQAHPYPDGRWIFFEVKTARDVRDLEHLIALKAGAAKRKRINE